MATNTMFDKRQNTSPRRQRGVSLIEILLTVLIFSIGLLGIAGLQLLSKRSNFEAIQRTTASMLTNDIVERMRSNTEELDGYLTAAAGGGSLGAEPNPTCIRGNECNTQQLASHDMWEWERAIDGASEQSGGANTGGLVNPTACITGPAGGGPGNYFITIAWRGLTPLTNQAVTNCGNGNYGTDEEYRRFIIINTFIGSES